MYSDDWDIMFSLALKIMAMNCIVIRREPILPTFLIYVTISERVQYVTVVQLCWKRLVTFSSLFCRHLCNLYHDRWSLWFHLLPSKSNLNLKGKLDYILWTTVYTQSRNSIYFSSFVWHFYITLEAMKYLWLLVLFSQT